MALVFSCCGTASDRKADHGINEDLKISSVDINVDNKWTKKHSNKYISDNEHFIGKSINNINDEYNDNDIQVINTNTRSNNLQKEFGGLRHFNTKTLDTNNRMKRDANDPCDFFNYKEGKFITHPHPKDNYLYYSKNTTCVTVISTQQENTLIRLTFVDMFRIESHPQCDYDYLEIRDGLYGYANLIKKVCGQTFPTQITSSGPYLWLKFRSDDTIEYEGFKITIEFIPGISRKVPESCYMTFPEGTFHGLISTKNIDPACNSSSENQALDVLWTIETPKNTKIYLNFTAYALELPNECEANVIQVFGAVMELGAKLVQYCGSIANSVTTTDSETGNIMHVRFYASKAAKKGSSFNATFNAFRSLNVDPSVNDECIEGEEFDCEDSTCIDKHLYCDKVAHCRLKTDEESCNNNQVDASVDESHITVILVIFSLILSGMCFVFIFKCIKKLYQDHKIIKENIRKSCEDRLDSMGGSRLTLDPKRLQMDSEPRASLERENYTNEMSKQHRSFSKHKQSSIESDYMEETHLDLDEEPWRREVDSVPVEAEDIRIERNGRTRRSDLSRKEESLRSRTKETDGSREKKEIRDVSVGAPDTKESGCQTRESLFQTDPPPSSDGSGTNSRGFSTFGYSGGTIVRPTPPPTTKTAEVTIELFKQVPPKETKPQKKIDRRPISTETTRSAPDVIIVSKPIR